MLMCFEHEILLIFQGSKNTSHFHFHTLVTFKMTDGNKTLAFRGHLIRQLIFY